MKNDSLFIREEFSRRLSKKEMMILFNRMKQGDMEAREEFINNNIGLVINTVLNKFMNADCDKDELVAVGCEGLVKAVDTYDISKGNEFSTYARSCIYNEIATFLRKLKNNNKVLSFDDLLWKDISHDEEDTCIKLENMIPSGVDVEEEYVRKTYNEIQLRLLQQSMECLSERNREIVMLYFGFYNNKIHTQKEIANMMSLSQSQVSRIITKTVKNIGIQLQNYGIIETTRKINKKSTKINGVASQLSTTTPILNIQSQEKAESINQNRESTDESNVNVDERNLIKMKEERTESELISSKFKDSKLSLLQTTSEIEKDDCLKILKLTKTPSFGETLKSI